MSCLGLRGLCRSLLLCLVLGSGLLAQGFGPVPASNSRFGGGRFGAPAATSEPVSISLRAPPAPGVGESFELVVTLEHGEGYHTYAPGEKLGVPTEVVPAPAPGIEWGEPVFPEGKRKSFPLLGGDMLLFEGEVEIRVPGRVVAPEARKGSFSLTVSYAACTDTACLLPRDEVVGGTWAPAGDSAGVASPDSPAPVATSSSAGESHPGEAPAATAAPSVPAPAPTEGFGESLENGLLWALLMAYLWGLAASLSPCVYPMIPVTIAFFGSQSEGQGRGRTFLLALTYVAGIVLTYALAGVAAARVGRDLGSLLVNPWVVGLVSGLLFAMGLSLFGVFEIALPASLQAKLNEGDGKGLGGAFFTGAVMGLVAAPCVGPFASSILLFVAGTGDLFLGFLSLGAFGAGIGTLFLVLAMGVSELPRSGMWMVRVKKFFGFLLFGASFWFLGPLLDPRALPILWGVYLAIGADLGGAFDPVSCEGGKARRGLMLAMLAAGLYLVVAGTSRWVPLEFGGAPGVPAGGPARGELTWESDFEAAAARARESGKPVFADFYADWCIPCKGMEDGVFPDPEVQRLLGDFVLAKLDCTHPDSPGARLKNEVLKVPSMPYLAVFDSRGEHRPDLSHQGYLDAEAFRVLLQRARSALAPAP